MSLLSQEERKSKIRRGEPIEEFGLIFYPIKMSFYEQFTACKDALIVRLGTLPVKYQMKDYLNALFALELNSAESGGANAGFFSRLLRLLALSLRIDNFDVQDWLRNDLYVMQVGDGFEIARFTMTQGDKRVTLTPADFVTTIRPLIASQNGLELPDESENPELVLAQKQLEELKRANQVKLNVSVDSQIASVAYASHVREADIEDWTVREFDRRYKAIDREKRFMLYGQAEMSGMVSFPKGNPCPSWCFDAIDDARGTVDTTVLTKQTGGVNLQNK